MGSIRSSAIHDPSTIDALPAAGRGSSDVNAGSSPSAVLHPSSASGCWSSGATTTARSSMLQLRQSNSLGSRLSGTETSRSSVSSLALKVELAQSADTIQRRFCFDEPLPSKQARKTSCVTCYSLWTSAFRTWTPQLVCILTSCGLLRSRSTSPGCRTSSVSSWSVPAMAFGWVSTAVAFDAVTPSGFQRASCSPSAGHESQPQSSSSDYLTWISFATTISASRGPSYEWTALACPSGELQVT